MRGSTPLSRVCLEHGTEKEIVADLKDKQLETIALMNSWVFSRLICSLARWMPSPRRREKKASHSHLVLFFLTFLVHGPVAGLWPSMSLSESEPTSVGLTRYVTNPIFDIRMLGPAV